MRSLTINVIGVPVPQGSKVANRHGGGVRDSNAKKLKPWRADVAGIAQEVAAHEGWTRLDAPALVRITFYMPRLKGHYGTGRNDGVLKPTAPKYVQAKPDIDKLARAILDALTDADILRDDSRVARLVVEKRYADGPTGARITITPLLGALDRPDALACGEAPGRPAPTAEGLF